MIWKQLIGGVVVLLMAALVFVLFDDKGASPVAISLIAIGTVTIALAGEKGVI